MKIIVVFLVLLTINSMKNYTTDYYVYPTPQSISMGQGNLLIPKNSLIKLNSNVNSNKLFEEMQTVYLELLNQGKNPNLTQTFPVQLEFILSDEYISPFPNDLEGAQKTEYYEVIIEGSSILIKINYLNGLPKALETLSQIIRPYNDEADHISNIPLMIIDYPIFPIRGVMIDTARNYISFDNMKNIIRGIQHSKLNTLHWHIIDDDNFSFQSLVFPGIYRNPERMYTQVQIKELIHFARLRGIQILCEFDQPAHTRSWGLNKPFEEITIPYDFNLQHSSLNPAIEETFQVAEGLLNEGISLFESKDPTNSSSYNDFFHLGGDEVVYSVWQNNTDIQELMKLKGFTNIYQVFDYYLTRVRGSIPANKNYFYWIGADYFTSNLSQICVYTQNNSILQYWGQFDQLASFHNQKNVSKINMILSPSDYVYLDCGMGNKYGGNSWCDPFHTWYKILSLDMYKYNGGNFNILGSIACLWSELVNDYNVMSKMFPRASALSEILWMDYSKDKPDMFKLFIKINILTDRFAKLGVGYSPITNFICHKHPDICQQFIGEN